ncbi:lipocalin-like domain-containing protein [Maribacter antarcticus]|uniref:lipocalin family protein n=1 Tax=Maribacter antarcticus TaxID=505250 RepID=UPI00056177E4|nr:lipocalin family protein [Maribacter antarcticus]
MIKNYKELKNSIKTVSITSLLIIAVSSNIFGQEDMTNMLFDTWYLDTYKIESKEYPPNKNEKGDYIFFKEDMTFISKSEGKEEEGTYTLNTNGAYVVMSDKNGKNIKAYIISISKKSLILKYDISEISDVEVQYNKPI